jgi:carbon monoxide dehydrogenase subunit G
MFKLLKLLFLLVLLAAAAGAGIGYAQDPHMVARTTIRVDAPIAKVWAVVSDPRRTPEWLPQDLMKIDKVELMGKGLLEKAAGAALDAAIGIETKSGEKTPTHRYVGADGKVLGMQVTAAEKNKRYMERVVEDTTGMGRFFESMSWGFELAEEGGKTKLTLVQDGMGKKPLGTLLAFIMQKTGKTESNARRMAANIEALAKK